MCMSLAPPIANLCFCIFEEENVVNKVSVCIDSLNTFIDGDTEMWDHEPNPIVDDANWERYKSTINSCGLEWTFLSHSQSIAFMDTTISTEGGNIATPLYTKPPALYLYIPPHSCHAPGVLTRLICRILLRIYQLCSKEKDVER